MFSESQQYTPKSLEQAVKKIQPMSADLGRTEIYRALEEILKENVNKGYPKQVFLLTDGGVSYTEGIPQHDQEIYEVL